MLTNWLPFWSFLCWALITTTCARHGENASVAGLSEERDFCEKSFSFPEQIADGYCLDVFNIGFECVYIALRSRETNVLENKESGHKITKIDRRPVEIKRRCCADE